jgi:hypothetical protein
MMPVINKSKVHLLKKIVFIKLICFFALLSCQTISSKRFTKSKYNDLDDFKKMTKYIVDGNYHDGFKNNLLIDRDFTNDSTIINFIIYRHIIGIYITGKIEGSEEYMAKYRDSIIEYHFNYVPVFGKRKDLYFDFSSNPPKDGYKKNGVKQIILGKGIYWIEY